MEQGDVNSAAAARLPPPERSRFWRAAGLGAFALALAATAAISFRATNVTVTTRTPSWPAPPTVVASSPDLEYAPALSPDGRGLAYVRGPSEPAAEGLWKIYVKLPGDDAPRLLSPGTVCESPPAWSPDGGSIAFWRRGRGEASIRPSHPTAKRSALCAAASRATCRTSTSCPPPATGHGA
ncbi:MAG: hypothetical protein GY719_30855 [bacterium]|nr:hypothetical protein [bacterium]